MPLLRHTVDVKDVRKLNAQIEAYQKMIAFYKKYTEEKGEYDYVEERMQYLYNELAEHLIAKEQRVQATLC